jgi:hypothetical protein
VPPLALRPAPVKRTVLLRTTANQLPGQAATTALASITNVPDALTAEGEVDTLVYGHALRARKLVGVRGVGLTHDGLYYVRSVTHRIENGAFTQRFRLSREGTMTTTPVLP